MAKTASDTVYDNFEKIMYVIITISIFIFLSNNTKVNKDKITTQETNRVIIF